MKQARNLINPSLISRNLSIARAAGLKHEFLAQESGCSLNYFAFPMQSVLLINMFVTVPNIAFVNLLFVQKLRMMSLENY